MTDTLTAPLSTQAAFRLEEATIDDLHAAIREGRTTCVEVVKHYLARIRAFNGVASLLVTADGAGVAPATGTVRGGAPLAFPTATVQAASFIPDLDRYKGPPLEYGRMEPTASDPSVQQQFGMIVGVPDGTQLNALATLNIRGERSVTCRGAFDRHPALGSLPPGAPPVCEHFRRLPDALERAAELDAAYGRSPDLEAMPMYGVVFSFKDPFDTRDMRSTGGGDAAYDIDFPARDHVLVEQLRRKGAIIFAKAVCTEYNGRAGDPGGRHKPAKVLASTLGHQRSTWGGNPANVYDPRRSASLGSSSGSGVSVSANLVMASLGEETRASCRGPANHNAVALLLPHKAMLGFDGGAIGADIYCDRTGILCRTHRRLRQSARRARRTRQDGYYDPRDPYTTVPRASVLDTPYASHAGASRRARVAQRHPARRHPRVDADPAGPEDRGADRHGGGGRDQARARRAARRDAGRVRRSAVAARSGRSRPMKTDFRRALARLVPVFMPDLLFRLGPRRAAAVQGVRRRDRADRVRARQDLRQRHDGADRLLRRARRGHDRAAGNLDLATVQQQELAMAFRFHISQYLTRRAADWRAHGFDESLNDWADPQRALEILGRRPARRVQELGGGGRPAQPARRPPGRRRAHHAARAAAPRRHDGDPGEQARRAGAPAHAVAARLDRRRISTTSRAISRRSCCPARTPG